MTRILFALAALATLSACGVDGSPTHPEPRPTQVVAPGITVSGTAEFGIAGGS